MDQPNPRSRMARRGLEPTPAATLSADEFAARFQRGARVFWTLAAGILGDPTEADDVLQEAVLAALHKLDRFDPGTNFLAWMGRFVRNVAHNEIRKRGRRRTASTDPLRFDGAPADPSLSRNGRHAGSSPLERLAVGARGELGPDRGDFDDHVRAGLRELGDVPRSCLLLRAVLELSYAEIGKVLAIPEGTAMSHVHRSRLALRARLADAPESAAGAASPAPLPPSR